MITLAEFLLYEPLVNENNELKAQLSEAREALRKYAAIQDMPRRRGSYPMCLRLQDQPRRSSGEGNQGV